MQQPEQLLAILNQFILKAGNRGQQTIIIIYIVNINVLQIFLTLFFRSQQLTHVQFFKQENKDTYLEIQSKEHVFFRQTPSWNCNRSLKQPGYQAFWTLKFHRKLKRFWTTPIQSLQISQRMGNSISPHLENAQKTGVCSLCGQRLSEVRAIHDPLGLKCTDLQLFSQLECTLYTAVQYGFFFLVRETVS